MTASDPPNCPERHERDAPADRHVAAANWVKQANRRLHDDVLMPLWSLPPEIARLENELTNAHRRILAYEQSTSWRLTAPLRWIVQHISRLSRRVEAPPPPAAPQRATVRNPDADADYAAWIANDEAACQAALLPVLLDRATTPPPRLAVILSAVGYAEDAVAATLDSLRGQTSELCSVMATCRNSDAGLATLRQFAQLEPNTTVLTLPDETTAAASKFAALAQVDGDFVGFVEPPDRIAPNAIQVIANTLLVDPESDLVFCDEDFVDSSGRRHSPFFKPGWDPELQSAGDLFGRLLVIRRDALRRVEFPADAARDDWFRALGERTAAACRPERIRHIPAVLCHRAGASVAVPRWRPVRHVLPTPAPLLSLIVPTRDHADLLRVCADGVLRDTDYPQIELLILDNDTQEPEAVRLLHDLASDPRVRVVPVPGAFNWSAFNNLGARTARGEILVLLNNDIAVLQRDWLHELVCHAVRPEIGAVGARLLYPDGTMQHAGMVIDTDGVPKHVLRHAPPDTTALNGMFRVAHSVSAVTGACLAVRRAAFLEVGGLNESLAVAGSDVDLCLRLLAHGYRNVWTPFAVLEHRELATRGPDNTPAMRQRAATEFTRLTRDWGGAIFCDPHFNRNLELVEEQPSLRREPPAGIGARRE